MQTAELNTLPHKKRWFGFAGTKTLRAQKYLIFMSFPFVIWLFIFRYIPLWGWTIAFQRYMPGRSFFSQEWVGFEYFIKMFKDSLFYLVMRNTLAMSILSLIFCFTLPIVLAILLNEIKKPFKRFPICRISYHGSSWQAFLTRCFQLTAAS